MHPCRLSPAPPSLLSLSPFHPSACHRAPVWVPWIILQIPFGYLFYTWYCKFPCYSLHTSPLKNRMVFIYLFIFSFISISWRLIPLQHCSGFCHTLTWISHGFTCVPHPEPPFHFPLHPIPLGHPSAPAPSSCLMHPTWTGDLFHPW